ncbi:HxlR-like helix-turn-helix [Serratia rubidaea]|uniref:HxlR-like helix-turn-helix n=1 Tax=Serratia rubidaea TaxID=61652 RepID=A0A4U9HGA2_SERRU|nr:HxlR-like helix-turn-helix [Serratia rubidaea]
MSKNIALTPVSPALCGLAQAAELLGDRWTLLILREVFYGVTRFEQMREHIGATKQTLTTRLRKWSSRICWRSAAIRNPECVKDMNMC